MAQISSFGTDLGDATREPASRAFKFSGPFCDCTGEMVNGWRTKGSACGQLVQTEQVVPAKFWLIVLPSR
jgi:hypothetical protein